MTLADDERTMLAQSIRGVLEGHRDPIKQRAELVGLGIHSLLLSEEVGGAGLGPDELLLLAHEAGRVASSVPVTGPEALVGSILAGLRKTPATRSLLKDFANAAVLPTLASDDLDPVFVQTVDGSPTLNGAKRLVPDVHAANAFLVSASVDEDVGLFRIDRGTDGLSVVQYHDDTAGDLILSNVHLAPEMELLRGPGVVQLVAEARAMATLAVCARMVGSMEKLLELTLDHLRTRKQFGQALSSFQVLQHAAVDMYVEIETAKPMIQYGIATIGAPDADRAMALNTVKLKINDAAKLVGENAVQLHGGIGMTMEGLVGRLFADITKMRASYGDRRECLRSLVMQETSPALV